MPEAGDRQVHREVLRSASREKVPLGYVEPNVVGARADPAENGPWQPVPQQTIISDQIHWEAMRHNLDALRESVHDMARDRFQQHGIDLSEPAVLIADSQGRVLEVGQHWERARIEELMARDADLRQEVTRLLRQAASLYLGGAANGVAPTAGQVRLVLGQQGILFQAV